MNRRQREPLNMRPMKQASEGKQLVSGCSIEIPDEILIGQTGQLVASLQDRDFLFYERTSGKLCLVIQTHDGDGGVVALSELSQLCPHCVGELEMASRLAFGVTGEKLN